MNREIKFRIWSKENRYFADSFSPMFGFALVEYLTGGSMFGDKDNFEKQYVLQQWTGLKDKNGKDIYEGDIVLLPYDGHNYSVRFGTYCDVEDYEHYGWNIAPATCDVYGGSFAPGEAGQSEVVGNILENPEFLST